VSHEGTEKLHSVVPSGNLRMLVQAAAHVVLCISSDRLVDAENHVAAECSSVHMLAGANCCMSFQTNWHVHPGGHKCHA
jgi:hypothetical protein